MVVKLEKRQSLRPALLQLPFFSRMDDFLEWLTGYRDDGAYLGINNIVLMRQAEIGQQGHQFRIVKIRGIPDDDGRSACLFQVFLDKGEKRENNFRREPSIRIQRSKGSTKRTSRHTLLQRKPHAPTYLLIISNNIERLPTPL